MARFERVVYLALAVQSALLLFGASALGFPQWLCIVVWVLAPVAFLGFVSDAFSYDFSIRVKWYDLWVGAYVDHPTRTLYVCPLPCLLLTFQPESPARPSVEGEER
jgi:hypothetical protein